MLQLINRYICADTAGYKLDTINTTVVVLRVLSAGTILSCRTNGHTCDHSSYDAVSH